MTLLPVLASAELGTTSPQTSWEWWAAVLKIVLIDIVLAGDNAVVIALAVRRLGKKERLWGILLGSGVAVLLRVGLTLVAASLLGIPLIKLLGGALILWIAVKLLSENTGSAKEHKEASHLWHAVWLIAVADIVMSLDNVLAVAGASHGSSGLIWFGLVLSVPLVVFASNLLANWMNRWPVIVWIGAAILGLVGGEMIPDDELLKGLALPAPFVRGFATLCVVCVLAWPWWARRRARRAAREKS
jgi:YjbE family integral membrane protein